MEQQKQQINPKWVVLETADIDVGLSMIEKQQLSAILNRIMEGRAWVGKSPLAGVFVESTHPEFEMVLELIEDTPEEETPES